MINVNSITKQYKEVKALDAFQCCFDDGITALLGPNGAGKSTLMSILSTQNKPTEGHVLWNETDIADVKHEYLSCLSYMPQMQNLISNFTGYDFLYYIGYLKDISKEEIDLCIDQYKEALELSDCLSRKTGTYSGGMRQRLLFLSCLLSKPKILLLDEPTAGLDPMQRNTFKNIISELAGSTAVILATHIVQDVEDIADHIIIMDHGKVISDIQKDEISTAFEGYLYEGDLSKKYIEKLKSRYHVTMIQNHQDTYHVRFISKEKINGLKEVSPSMEDYYLSKIRR